MHFVRQGYTDRFLVLVAADTAQIIGLSDKVEAFDGFEMAPAETGMVVALVYDGLCFAVEQGGFYSVEVGRFRSP